MLVGKNLKKIATDNVTDSTDNQILLTEYRYRLYRLVLSVNIEVPRYIYQIFIEEALMAGVQSESSLYGGIGKCYMFGFRLFKLKITKFYVLK